MDIDKCCITRFPTPVLSQRAQPVEKIDDNIKELTQKQTMLLNQIAKEKAPEIKKELQREAMLIAIRKTELRTEFLNKK